MLCRTLFSTLATTVMLVACSSPVKIGLISSDEGLRSMLEERGYVCEDITPGSPLENYDLVWWNRTDTTAITPDEISAGPAFVRYIEKGGNVVLSMDAVRLGNAWGLEPNPVEENSWAAEDYGFGRKVGFHSYRSHPLFDGMHGGAYVWHGHQDNTCRVLGYPAAQRHTHSCHALGTYFLSSGLQGHLGADNWQGTSSFNRLFPLL